MVSYTIFNSEELQLVLCASDALRCRCPGGASRFTIVRRGDDIAFFFSEAIGLRGFRCDRRRLRVSIRDPCEEAMPCTPQNIARHGNKHVSQEMKKGMATHSLSRIERACNKSMESEGRSVDLCVLL